MEKANLIDHNDARILTLTEKIQKLTTKVNHDTQQFSGLKDLDLLFELIKTKLDLAIALVKQQPGPDLELRNGCFTAARQEAVQAVTLFEELSKQNISLDQGELISQAPETAEIKERIKALLLLGGGTFFEKRIDNANKRLKIARIINNALAKYISPDDRYEPLFKTEKLPDFLRRIVLSFLPVLGKENQQDPPYGIDEGEEEEIYYADKIKMPLSQAVYYLENEVLPGLQEKLQANPGERGLQEKIRLTGEKISEYKNIVVTPRATPISLEKGYYTDTYSSYTNDGELLVSIPVSVKFRSGTNLDRIQFHVKTEIVKNMAGKGILPELDREYRYLKKLTSGIRGNSRSPGMKIDTARWFIPLKKEIPWLACLENKQDFLMLINTITGSTKKRSLEYIDEMLQVQTSSLRELPGLEG